MVGFSPSDGPSSLMLRWPSLPKPSARVTGVVDALLRCGGTCGWNVGDQGAAGFELRGCFRSWVEGTGPGVNSAEGVTYSNFNAVAGYPASNLWQTAGGTGVLDSSNLVSVSVSYGEARSASVASFAELVNDWVDGVGTNNGIMLRVTSGGNRMLYGTIGGVHYDPYLSFGLIVVFDEPPAGSVFLFH